MAKTAPRTTRTASKARTRHPVPAAIPATSSAAAEEVRAMLRAEGRAGVVTSASVAPEQRPALDRVAQLTATLR